MLCSNIKKEKEKPQQIQVFVRSRPLNQQERDNRSTSCVDIVGSKELSIKQQHGKKYYFDRVFGPTTKQLEVYMSVVNPLIYEVLAGYNCTIFAYGQTGTGKTHTMAGGSSSEASISWENDELAGIIPRAMSHLFDELHLIQQEYTVRVSYLELYNEELYDLLAEGDECARIRLFEDQHQKGSVIIQGIEQVTVVNKNQVYKILEKGQDKRRTASTLMNTQSSRSHTVFTITVHTRETTVEGDVLVKTGKLNLVDLAGSENISRSGAVEKRAREAGSINQSLLTLGRVIKSLVERSGHIPYRESKLTRILQDSLGGRTKTSIIATISPATCNLEETLSTLEYANRARNITNRPEINQRMSQKAAIAQYCDEIEKLRKDLQAARTGTGIFVASDNYEQLVLDNENSKEALASKITIIRDLEVQLKNLEDQKDVLELNWKEMRTSFDITNKELNDCKALLQKTSIEKDEQEYLATCFEERARKIYDEFQVLLNITKTSKILDSALRDKIQVLYSMAQENYEATKKTSVRISSKFADMLTNLDEQKEKFEFTNNILTTICHKAQAGHNEPVEIVQSFIDNILKELKTFQQTFKESLNIDSLSMRALLDRFVTSCQDHVLNIDNTWCKDSLNVCQSMKNIVHTHNQDQANLGDFLKTQVINRHENNVSSYKLLANEFDEDKEALLAKISDLKKSEITQKHHYEDIQGQIIHSQQNLQQVAELCVAQQKLINTLFVNFSSLQDSIDSSNKIGVNNLTTISATHNHLLEVSNKINSKTENNIQEESHTLAELLDTILKTDTQRNKFQSKHFDIVNAIETNCKLGQTNIKEALTKNVEVFAEELCNHQENIQREETQAVEMFNANMNTYMHENKVEMENVVSQLKTHLAELSAQLEESAKNQIPYDTIMSDNLIECQELLTTFTNMKLKEIKPSGETPVRPQYSIPTNVKAPTPKERILSKFQERLQLMNHGNEGDDTMEILEQQELGDLNIGDGIGGPSPSGFGSS